MRQDSKIKHKNQRKRKEKKESYRIEATTGELEEKIVWKEGRKEGWKREERERERDMERRREGEEDTFDVTLPGKLTF